MPKWKSWDAIAWLQRKMCLRTKCMGSLIYKRSYCHSYIYSQLHPSTTSIWSRSPRQFQRLTILLASLFENVPIDLRSWTSSDRAEQPCISPGMPRLVWSRSRRVVSTNTLPYNPVKRLPRTPRLLGKFIHVDLLTIDPIYAFDVFGVVAPPALVALHLLASMVLPLFVHPPRFPELSPLSCCITSTEAFGDIVLRNRHIHIVSI